MQTKEEALDKLEKSKFRSSFYLTAKDVSYIREKGAAEIKRHIEDFVRDRLVPPAKENDGKQTPYRSNPVFKAMHATACCCRGCLYKWYKVPKDTALSAESQEKIAGLLTAWLNRQLEKYGEKI